MRSRLYSLVLATREETDISSATDRMETTSEESDFNNNANSTSPSNIFDQTSFSCSDMTLFHDFDEAMRGDDSDFWAIKIKKYKAKLSKKNRKFY